MVCTLGLAFCTLGESIDQCPVQIIHGLLLKLNFFHSWVVVVKVANFIVVVSKKITFRFCVIIHCNGKK
jgi:hypothetical protein